MGLKGATYYTPEQYTRGIEEQSGRPTTDGDRWPLLYESSSPPMPRRRSRSVYLSSNGSAKAGHVTHAIPAGCFPKAHGAVRAKIFRFFPAGLAGLAKTGMQT